MDVYLIVVCNKYTCQLSSVFHRVSTITSLSPVHLPGRPPAHQTMYDDNLSARLALRYSLDLNVFLF